MVLGIADPGNSYVVEQIVEKHPRLKAGLIASNAMMTLEAVSQLKPALVLMADDSPGTRGVDVIADMFAASPDTIIIMLAAGSDPAYLRQHPEVFQAVTIMNPAGIKDALASAIEYLDNPDAVESVDGPTRRKSDRRIRQEWSKVFAERRDARRRS